MLAVSIPTAFRRRSVASQRAAAGASLPALLARRRLGGQTGDVLGAVQQCAEIGFLLVFIADP